MCPKKKNTKDKICIWGRYLIIVHYSKRSFIYFLFFIAQINNAGIGGAILNADAFARAFELAGGNWVSMY